MIDAIFLSSRLAVMDDGSIRPITNMLDAFGDECEPSDCVSVIVCEAPDKWHVIPIQVFQFVAVH